MEKLKSFFNTDRYATLSRIELIELSEGYARARVEIDECHLNSVGIAHGGIIFTLGDFAKGAAANSHGRAAVAINVSIAYTKPGRKGDVLIAEAREESTSKRTSTSTVRITNQNGDLVAHMQGTSFRRDDKFPPQ